MFSKANQTVTVSLYHTIPNIDKEFITTASTVQEDEIEDLVGDVRYTDSQKSVTTSNAYSPDFTDSSSDKNHSSGKDTYVIDWDDSDDSDRTFQIRHNPSIVDLKNHIEHKSEKKTLNNDRSIISAINRTTGTSLHQCVVSQEIYTQTSKTIFELVANDNEFQCARDSRTLQTQTSVLSVIENKTTEYKIQIKGVSDHCTENESLNDTNTSSLNKINHNLNHSHDTSSKYPESETQNEITQEVDSDSSFSDRLIQFIDAESNVNILDKDINENSGDLESSKFDSDIDEDSLMVNEYRQNKSEKLDSVSNSSVPKSVDNEVEDLYIKISESIDLFLPEKPIESNLRRFGTLTPLTEETIPKRDSIIDVTPSIKSIKHTTGDTRIESLVQNPIIRPASSADYAKSYEKEKLKLPPIHQNKSCPNSPNLNFLFATSPQANRQNIEDQREILLDKWELCTNRLACGESPLINGRNDSVQHASFHLPPIRVEGLQQNIHNKTHTSSRLDSSLKESSIQETITIKDKITELKSMERKIRQNVSRSASPRSTSSPDEGRLGDVAERGCEARCGELLRRLRSSIWTEVAEAMEDIPRDLDKFWNVLSETRIADLLRQVIVHVDSPRTQVARLACNTIATILKNTNYTKKPDFFEAVTTLLHKTGSLSRPVRRAANVALDDVVCGVELTHAVTALCVHGVGHKSALVRSAAMRLLVVCCALAAGGRGLLRARPPSAAAARRHALRALAAALDDKNIETRKYAERLYTMLRPLDNFEAYFLIDADVEVAARQMKRLDQLARAAHAR